MNRMRNPRAAQDVFGENVKRIRERRKLTKAELARRAGFSRSNIGRIESGTINPSLATMTQIAIKLNKPLKYFLIDRSE